MTDAATEVVTLSTPADYIRALITVDPVLSKSLFSIHADLTDEELETLELLERIEVWEDEHFPHAPMEAYDALRLWLEVAGIAKEDAVEAFGTEAEMNAVLAGERPVTGALCHALVEKLHFPMSVLTWPVGWKARRVGRVMTEKLEAKKPMPFAK